MDAARKGEAALSASSYDEAIEHFTDAIKSNPAAVKYYIGRATAYQRVKKYAEALADSELAVVLAHKRATRELIKDAQFRRAQQLFFLERYADAERILEIVKKIDEKEKTLPIWSSKVAKKLQEIPEGDEKRKVTVMDVPDVEAPSISQDPTAVKKTDAPAAVTKPIVRTPATKIKDDWYQSNEIVTINVLAKGVPKDKVTVEFSKDSLSVSFPVEGSGAEYNLDIDPLYASIDPAESKFRVTPNKVEIILKKASKGMKWKALESDREVKGAEDYKGAIPQHILNTKPVQDSALAYPTSSKSGAKNWDKLAAEDLDEKDEIEGDETNHFFQKLYSGASQEQQRAMMKSYSESGGTVLSTDWSNVGSKTVVPEPPEGMEARKY